MSSTGKVKGETMSVVTFEMNIPTANRYSADWLAYQQWWIRKGHKVEITMSNTIPDNVLRITIDVRCYDLNLRTKTAAGSWAF